MLVQDTIRITEINIFALMQRGYFYKLNNSQSADKLHPIVEFSNKTFSMGIGDKAKEGFLEKRTTNYWYSPGKIAKDEIRIFFMEKPFNDLFLTVEGFGI